MAWSRSPLIFLMLQWGASDDYPHSTDEKLRLRDLVPLAHYSQQVVASPTWAQRQRQDRGAGGFAGAGETDPSGAGTQGVVGVLYPGGSSRSLAPSSTPGGGWAAPLSQARVRAGRACAPQGRCQGLHNGAPGVGARPAHSALNNHCSTAAGPAASRGGRTGGQQMGPGCQISSPGFGGGSEARGQLRMGGGRGSGPGSPREGGRDRVGVWGETVCPPPLPPRAGQRGNTGPKPDGADWWNQWASHSAGEP